MKLSKERLLNEVNETGFRPENLEKVIRLLDLLPFLYEHPFLKGRLVLKGGTALNLFYFDVPRLSVDIDLNYIGSVNLEVMKKERPNIEKGVQAVLEREHLRIVRIPGEHAGGKWRLSYNSAIGDEGKLEVDINFMYRLPLWPIVKKDSALLGSFQACDIPVLDIHELTAGKLAALFTRSSSRDLFDAHLLLTQGNLDPAKLRLAFVVYGAMSRKDWRTISSDEFDFDPITLKNELLPMLRIDALDKLRDPKEWADRLIDECRDALKIVLPLSTTEINFLDRILDHGELVPQLLTDHPELTDRISNQPLLMWKTLNVKNLKSE